MFKIDAFSLLHQMKRKETFALMYDTTSRSGLRCSSAQTFLSRAAASRGQGTVRSLWWNNTASWIWPPPKGIEKRLLFFFTSGHASAASNYAWCTLESVSFGKRMKCLETEQFCFLQQSAKTLEQRCDRIEALRLSTVRVTFTYSFSDHWSFAFCQPCVLRMHKFSSWKPHVLLQNVCPWLLLWSFSAKNSQNIHHQAPV